MFVGHYGVAFAARGAEKRLPLWVYFLAVQWVDLVWTVLVFFGVERVHIQPGVNPSGPLVFDFYPYTHSLAAGLAWAAIAFMGYRVITRMKGSQRVAAFLALAVLSHWFLDLIVHQPDLALYPGGLKVGLGLWNFPKVELAVELLLLTAGLVYYFRKSPELSKKRRIGMVVLCLIIIAIQLAGDFGPPPPSVKVMAVSGFALYAVFTALAAWAEGRAAKSHP
ncbi:MAG TPA: hypothetical protein VGO35_09525 [Gammaproteobacteria bacterium]|jgi:hypothetical protein|nr:hypothetical protein [Gammaproteobacteria bacterium]